MVVIINDPLAGTSGSLAGRTGPDGTPWVQHPVHAGNFAFASNRVYPSLIGAVYANVAPGTSEYDIECSYQVLSDVSSMGIAGRISPSADTMYYCYYLNSEVVLAKRVTGTITSLAVLAGFTLSVGAHTLKLEIRNAAKNVYVDGILRATSADNTITATGFAGFRAGSTATSSTGKHASNFTVTDLTVPAAVMGRFTSFAM
jgi:hypothetical protein